MMPPPQYQVHLILYVLRNGPAMNANGVDLEAWLRDDLPKEGWLSEQSAEELEVLHLWSVAVLLDPRRTRWERRSSPWRRRRCVRQRMRSSRPTRSAT